MTPNNNPQAQIIFYSRTGKTSIIAEIIKDTFGYNLQEIIDLKNRSGILGYIGGVIDIWLRPLTEISPSVVDIKDYSLLFIGAPLWGGKFPPAITTFFSSAHFSGKKVVLFATCGSRMKQTLFDEYSKRIRASGGEVAGHFYLRTRSKSNTALQEETQKILDEHRGEWLKSIEN